MLPFQVRKWRRHIDVLSGRVEVIDPKLKGIVSDITKLDHIVLAKKAGTTALNSGPPNPARHGDVGPVHQTRNALEKVVHAVELSSGIVGFEASKKRGPRRLGSRARAIHVGAVGWGTETPDIVCRRRRVVIKPPVGNWPVGLHGCGVAASRPAVLGGKVD